MASKICNVCKEIKSIEEFSKAITCIDGHRNYCGACQKLKKDEWRSNNKEHHNAKCREWALTNPEKRAKSVKKWNSSNKTRIFIIQSAWRKKNKLKVNLCTATRRKRIKQATPLWTDKTILRDFYLEANYFNMEMDHIIPLKSDMVCGLHVPNNIQLLTKAENSSKGNSFSD